MSVAVITRKRRRAARELHRSVALAEAIVAVDSGFTDGTVELAARHGARNVGGCAQ
jgi:glycosyltransferase involved in cell wall biosynthesis